MNIIVPEMLQNALTETMTVEEAANDAADRINDPDRVPLMPAAKSSTLAGWVHRPASAPFLPGASSTPMAIAEAPTPSPLARRTGRHPDARDAGGLPRISRHWADYLYVLPALLVMLVVIGYPLIYTVWLSFHATPPRTGERVLQRHRELPGHPAVIRASGEQR